MTSGETGNTAVEQWLMDLTANRWTHLCTYDTGLKDSCFAGSFCFFLECFAHDTTAEVRSMEIANIRIRSASDGGWRDVTRVYGMVQSHMTHQDGTPYMYGTCRAGADEDTFYMITSGVLRGEDGLRTGPLTIRNRESGAPYDSPLFRPGFVRTGDPRAVRPVNGWFRKDARFLAARYEGGRMADTAAGTLRADGTVLFDKALGPGWRLFTLSPGLAPLQEAVTLD